MQTEPSYRLPAVRQPQPMKPNQVLLVASGDLRLSANERCWPAQQEMEQSLSRAVTQCGFELLRAHPYKPTEKHGFIGSQKEGMRGLRENRSPCAAHRGRGGLAILASRACMG